MNKELMEFWTEFTNKIDILHDKYNTEKCSILIKENIDYWTVDFMFTSYNASYNDSILVYEGEDFEAKEILSDLDEIIDKAEVLLK